jgi:hypothetical protein
MCACTPMHACIHARVCTRMHTHTHTQLYCIPWKLCRLSWSSHCYYYCSLHDCMKLMHMGLTLCVFPSICIFQCQSYITDIDEVLYDIGVYPKTVLFSSLQSVILTWQINELLMLVDSSTTYSGFIPCYMVTDFKNVQNFHIVIKQYHTYGVLHKCHHQHWSHKYGSRLQVIYKHKLTFQTWDLYWLIPIYLVSNKITHQVAIECTYLP